MNSTRGIAYLKLVVTMLIWGGTFVAAKAISRDISPVSATFLRFSLASLGLLTLIYLREGRFPKVKWASVPLLIFLGASGVASYNFFFFKGLQTVDAGRASLIVATNPVFISFFSALIFREKLSRINSFGILISVFGAILLISRGDLQMIAHGGIAIGDVLIFGCVISWVSFSLAGKLSMQKVSAIHSVFWSAVFGSLIMFVPATREGLFSQVSLVTPFQWSMLAYLGIFATVMGFLWYYEGIREFGAAKASIFINLVPLSANGLSVLFYGESITLLTLMAALLVISGVYLSNLKNQKREVIPS